MTYVSSPPGRTRLVYDALAEVLPRKAGIQLHTEKTRVWNAAGVRPVNLEDVGPDVWNPRRVSFVVPADLPRAYRQKTKSSSFPAKNCKDTEWAALRVVVVWAWTKHQRVFGEFRPTLVQNYLKSKTELSWSDWKDQVPIPESEVLPAAVAHSHVREGSTSMLHSEGSNVRLARIRVPQLTASREVSRDTRTCPKLTGELRCRQWRGNTCLPPLRQTNPHFNRTDLSVEADTDPEEEVVSEGECRDNAPINIPQHSPT